MKRNISGMSRIKIALLINWALLVAACDKQGSNNQPSPRPSAQSAATAVASPSTTAAIEPTIEQARLFGEKIADAWLGENGKPNVAGTTHNHVLRDIQKRSTDSVLHPTIWTFVLDDAITDGAHATYRLCFFWDGQRFQAGDSSVKNAGDTSESAISVTALDRDAKKIQNH